MNHLHDESKGGPAFPAMEVRTADTGDLVANASQGMTLRDWFAGKALGKMADIVNYDGHIESFQKSVAAQAYSQADAMLAERVTERQATSSIAQAKIAQLREQGFDYPVVATLQNGMHVCTVDNFGAVRWFSSDKYLAFPEGYKLVPIEPTQAMIDATQMLLVGARDDQGQQHGLYGSEARYIYKLMIGAFHASK